jgi:hypothetical protein
MFWPRLANVVLGYEGYHEASLLPINFVKKLVKVRTPCINRSIFVIEDSNVVGAKPVC